MRSLCLYFSIHQPYRLKEYSFKDIEVCHCYEDTIADKQAINSLADNSYLPTNEILYEMICHAKGKFRISFSISGTALELFQKHRPDVIRSFQKLMNTGCVEILGETFYHSLSSLYSDREFKRQVVKHSNLVTDLLGVKPTVFRNTELIHNNKIAKAVAEQGFKGLLCEGVEKILKGRSPNQLYTTAGSQELVLLLRNARLSDDIAFRFDDTSWNEHPLTADKFAEWLHAHPSSDETINLLLDYETFGIHKKAATGIFDFLKALPAAVLSTGEFKFSTPSTTINEYEAKHIYDVPATISWEDDTNTSGAWGENVMQNNTARKIYSIEEIVLNCGNETMIDTWGRLQAADHFYYMSEGGRNTEQRYQNPFSTSVNAFRNYTNIATDFEITLIRKEIEKSRRRSSAPSLTQTIF